ncbi:lysophospholipid acyltransferase family protein [Streptomyces varsoviensis]|nr:lysophospholipid acyltransferase family protein [Streptomyces varsoviensis]
MNPWAVDARCTPGCAAHAAPRVPLAEAVRRYAALTYEMTRGVAKGERLAEFETLRAQARGVLAALGVRLEAAPGPLSVSGPNGVGTLIVANHVSWLDIVAVLAVEPATLLAKREVGGWPVIGTLARRIGTRFIDREGLRALPGAVAELTGTLRSGRSVVVFPQATTWCSTSGGRFRRATFQAAIDAGAPVRPITIDYRQHGAPSTVAAFLGDEDFGTSLRRVVSAGGLSVRVTAHPQLAPGADRRALAARTRSAVCSTESPAHV